MTAASYRNSIRMIRELNGTRPLSVILKPVPDELLSSWITRHADFYGVPPLTMLRHAIPEATSLRQTDTTLGPTAAVQIARLFRSQSSTISAMTTSGFPQSAARLVAPRVIQRCVAWRRSDKQFSGTEPIHRPLVNTAALRSMSVINTNSGPLPKADMRPRRISSSSCFAFTLSICGHDARARTMRSRSDHEASAVRQHRGTRRAGQSGERLGPRPPASATRQRLRLGHQ